MIQMEEKAFWLGVDKPYMNIKFHKDCYQSIKSDLLLFLQENINNLLDIYNNRSKNPV